MQTWFELHTVPQVPQLFGSKRETQVLPQRWLVPLHWQTPWLQVPPLHELPQAPHEFGSVWVLMHWPLQVE